MILPAFLLIGIAFGQDFTVPLTVSEPARIALTPNIDGKLEPEEWDPLATNGNVASFMQWEPGKIHLAATVPIGKDVVFSLDLGADGWLLGQNNLEVRASWKDGNVELAERLLDGTVPSGPTWMDASAFSAATTAKGSAGDATWSVEVTIEDPGVGLIPVKPDAKLRVRVDEVDPGSAPAEPYMPRETALVQTTFDRGMNVPQGMRWKPEFRGRTVMPGGRIRIRVTFNRDGDLDLSRIDMRTEGLAAQSTRNQGVPFPSFDKKGRAFVDYDTDVADDASQGYRVLRSTVTDASGTETILQTSYEIAPLVQFDFVREGNLRSSDEPRSEKFSVWLRSNSMRRVSGQFSVIAPSGFTVESGSDKSFIIANPRGSKRQVFSLMIPGGFKGTIPLRLRAEFPGSDCEKLIWLTIP